MKKISVSIMCADYRNLEDQVNKINDFTDYYHFDLMDGHYVPNLTLNFDILETLNEMTERPINAHLMVTNPEDYLPKLAELGADSVSYHINTIENQAFRIIKETKEKGLKAGVILNPFDRPEEIEYLYDLLDYITVMTVDPGFAGQEFIPQMLDKIKKLKNLKEENNYDYEIVVDGSVNEGTMDRLIEAGTEVFIVGGSGLFSLGEDVDEAIENARDYIPFK